MTSTPQAVAAPVVFREARFEDFEEISSVQSRNGLVAKPLDEWMHLWSGNPTYQRMGQWRIGWVAENEDGKIVGYAGHVPLSYDFRGRQVIAACAHGLVIDPVYRGYGVHLLKRHLGDRLTDVVLTSTANLNSGRLCDALCSRVPTGNWEEASFWITDHRGFAASTLQSKRWPKWLSLPASTALSLQALVKKSPPFRTAEGTGEIQACSGFDDRFDAFWETLKTRYPERFLATRSSELLQWHFKYALERGKVWIVTAGNSHITAYGIFCRDDNPAIGLKRIRLTDYQTLSEDPDPLIRMLAWSFRRCQEESIHMLEAFGFHPDKQQVVNSLKPYRRRLPFWRYFYRTRDKVLRQQLTDPTVWDPSHFDADSTL